MPKLLILPRETVRTRYHSESNYCVPYTVRGVLSSCEQAVRQDFIFIFPESGELCRCQFPAGAVLLCTDNELEIAISHLLLALLWNLILPCPFLISLSTGGVPRGSGKCTAQNLDKTAAFWNKKMGVMGWEMSRNCLASSVLIKHLSGWLMLETLGFQLF